MKPAALTLVVALAGGAVGGALALRFFVPPASNAYERTVGDTAEGARDLATRVAALEARARADDRPRLSGRPDAAPAPVSHLAPEARADLIEALSARIDERVEAKVEEIVEREGLGAKGTAGAEKAGRRRLTLSEAAAEVGLSAAQELALRDLYADYEQQWVEILTGEDGDTASTRADLERFRSDPSSRKVLGQKYMPRIVGNLSRVMAAEMSLENAVTEAIGPEKQALLKEFDIEEASPLGAGGSVSIGAQMTLDR